MEDDRTSPQKWTQNVSMASNQIVKVHFKYIVPPSINQFGPYAV